MTLTRKVDSGKRTQHALQKVAQVDGEVDDLSAVRVGIQVDGHVEVIRHSRSRDEKSQTLYQNPGLGQNC